MLDSNEYTAISTDDEWYDEMTLWSLAERNMIFDVIDALNTAYLPKGYSYCLQIISGSEDGLRPASIELSAQAEAGLPLTSVQNLADCICRLVRPSRYFSARSDEDDQDDDNEIWSHVFQTNHISSHQRLLKTAMIPELAAELGRSDYGIEAALSEIAIWTGGHSPAFAL